MSIKVKYVEAPPEAYTRQELEDLFRVSDEDEKFPWRFFLGTGFRESEVSVAEITDVNRDTKTIRVDEKPYFGFKPKDCEKRHVPIPDALISEIDARTNSGSCSLLFGNNGRPDGHLLRLLKQVTFEGGLNCGKCKGTVSGKKSPAPKHRSARSGFCTGFARTSRPTVTTAEHPREKSKNGWDMPTLTTLLYLAFGEDTSEEVRNIVNGVHLGL